MLRLGAAGGGVSGSMGRSCAEGNPVTATSHVAGNAVDCPRVALKPSAFLYAVSALSQGTHFPSLIRTTLARRGLIAESAQLRYPARTPPR